MLEDQGYENVAIGKKSAERCKPDYETMIRRIKERLDRSINFRDAALLYFEGRKARDKMAELIGELVTDCNQLQREHDNLIQAQETDGSV